MLAEWSAWGFFEGLGEALAAALGASLAPEITEQLRAAHEQAVAQNGNYALALRQCASALALICAEWRVVLLFDEFDPLFTQLDSRVLRNLRGLRDRHKYRLMYITFTRQPLTDLRDIDDWDEIEPFVELLSLRELGIGPLRADDAAAEADRFAGRHNKQLDPRVRAQIGESSGGHPAILRALTQASLDSAQPLDFDGPKLLRRPALRQECTKIWQQLTGDERDGLLRVARSEPLDSREQQLLALKGLLRADRHGSIHIFSPLFTAYLQAIGLPPAYDAPAPIFVDPEQSTIMYYGRNITDALRPLERQMVFYLWRRFGQICPLADVATALYPNEMPVDLRDSRELDRVRTVARRLHQNLASMAPDQPVLFSIHRKQGLRLGFAQPDVPPPSQS